MDPLEQNGVACGGLKRTKLVLQKGRKERKRGGGWRINRALWGVW